MTDVSKIIGQHWSTDYPTPASREYRDSFLAGAEQERLDGIPDRLLSLAITSAIASGWEPVAAGRKFAALYWNLAARESVRRGKVGNFHAYLLGSFYSDLEKDKVVL